MRALPRASRGLAPRAAPARGSPPAASKIVGNAFTGWPELHGYVARSTLEHSAIHDRALRHLQRLALLPDLGEVVQAESK